MFQRGEESIPIVYLKRAKRAFVYMSIAWLGVALVAMSALLAGAFWVFPVNTVLFLLLLLMLNGIVLEMRMRARSQRSMEHNIHRQLDEQRRHVETDFHHTIQQSQKRILEMDHKHNKDLYLQLESLHNLHHKLDLVKPLPSLTGGAASPEFALQIADTIDANNYQNVVDIGSGISSAVAGYAVKNQKGGSVVAVDHDERFYTKTKQLVDEHGLSEVVTVRHAPLEEYELGEEKHQWYQWTQFENIETIDLLLVDGPPGFVQTNARYPALPLLYNKLSPRATVIIDDYKRDEELAMVDKWLEQFPEFELEVIHSRKGMAILHRGGDS